MSKYQTRESRNSTACGLGGAILMLGACLSASSAIAGTANRTLISESPTLVAAGNALSDAAMAKQTGTGLRRQEIIAPDPNAGPKVQLWDELRIGPLIAPVISGMTAGSSRPN